MSMLQLKYSANFPLEISTLYMEISNEEGAFQDFAFCALFLAIGGILEVLCVNNLERVTKSMCKLAQFRDESD